MVPAEKMKKLVPVIGMHRSGTSAITRALVALGVDVGTDLMPPIPNNNETGFWEDRQINALNREIMGSLGYAWHSLHALPAKAFQIDAVQSLKGKTFRILKTKTERHRMLAIKDPRLSLLLPFWEPLFGKVTDHIFYVLALRNPLSVAHSLEKRDGFEPLKSYLMWWQHMTSAVEGCVFSSVFSGSTTKSCLVVNYDYLIANPIEQLQRLATFLKLPFSAETSQIKEFIHSFLNPGLQHTRFSRIDCESDQDIPKEIVNLFSVLEEVSTDRQSIESEELFNEIKNSRKQLISYNSVLKVSSNSYRIVDRLQTKIRHKQNELETLSKEKASITTLQELFKKEKADIKGEFRGLAATLERRSLDAETIGQQIDGIYEGIETNTEAISQIGPKLSSMVSKTEQLDQAIFRTLESFTAQSKAERLNNLALFEKFTSMETTLNILNQEMIRPKDLQIVYEAIQNRLDTFSSDLKGNLENFQIQLQFLEDRISNLPEFIYDAIHSDVLKEWLKDVVFGPLFEKLQELESWQTAKIKQLEANKELSNYLKELQKKEEQYKSLLLKQNNRFKELESQAASLKNEIENIQKLNQELRAEIREKQVAFKTKEHSTAVLEKRMKEIERSLIWRVLHFSSSIWPFSWWATLKNRKIYKEVEIIRQSGTFDADYYLKSNRDVFESQLDPLFHFVAFGAEENRNPSRNFNTKWYLDANADVNKTGLNPLVHYIKYGRNEGRSPLPPENEKPTA